ncbi:hypothetical protein FQV26_11290 [Planococcus sp. CPCC 101016]|uniref:TIGR04104 family putative zinc finger protein n=1 Tax=Planococcus sp. CPCC 101016 TaxID=2599617 RepID=UPI0011B81DCD|nr:TIGR04104 family putative zinc finger protein [Planococcus sp. CPCC 101016]TWT08365.1 hypothetical protein FQV26_11290 [Planococcus sp. CPCC 101016]
MPTCKSCGIRWSWKQTMKASWKFSGAMNCPHCQSSQYATPKSKQRMTYINWLVLLPLPFSTIWDIPLSYTIMMMSSLIIVDLSLIPKMIELSNEQKPLW